MSEQPFSGPFSIEHRGRNARLIDTRRRVVSPWASPARARWLRDQLGGDPAQKEWRCFHCDEVFTDPESARDHFGASLDAEPVCQIADLAHLLRIQEYELRQHREEDSLLIRRVAEITSEHARQLRNEEEKGYARGMRDVQKIVREKIDAEIARLVERATLIDAPAIAALSAMKATLEKEGAA